MKNIKDKINNVTTEEGFLTAEDTNSIINEIKNAVSTFIDLNSADDHQLSKAIDIASKSLFYKDIGSKDKLHLVRTSTQNNIEALIDGTTVMFTPANANTGDFKIKLNTLASKDAKNATGDNFPGFLQTDELYIAVFDKENDVFNIYQTSINVSEYMTLAQAKKDHKKITDTISNLKSSVNDDIKAANDRMDDLSDRIDAVELNADFGTL